MTEKTIFVFKQGRNYTHTKKDPKQRSSMLTHIMTHQSNAWLHEPETNKQTTTAKTTNDSLFFP